MSEGEFAQLDTAPPDCRDAETITGACSFGFRGDGHCWTALQRSPLGCAVSALLSPPPDVCNSTDLPEFEIISLLEEQLPVYRLRADTVYGYDHDDWLHTPLVAPDARFDLTAEQIEETLKYFCKFAGRFCVPVLPQLSLLAFRPPVRVFAVPVLTHGCEVNGVQLRSGSFSVI